MVDRYVFSSNENHSSRRKACNVVGAFSVLFWKVQNPVSHVVNLVSFTEQLNLWRYARGASQLPHPTTQTGVKSKRDRANLASQWKNTNANMLYSEKMYKLKSRPTAEQKCKRQKKIPGEGENWSQLFYCERCDGPVIQLGAHLVQIRLSPRGNRPSASQCQPLLNN